MSMPDLIAFGFSPDHQALYETVSRYSRDELLPLAERMDLDDWFPEEQMRSLAGVGLLGTTAAEEDGGRCRRRRRSWRANCRRRGRRRTRSRFSRSVHRRRSYGLLESCIHRVVDEQ